MKGQALWRLDEVVAACNGQVVGQPADEFAGVSIDSRTIKPGELFIAIAGERFDGHDFVKSALAAGAGAAVVSRLVDGGDGKGGLIVTADALAAMESLARAARARSAARVIAVTGSVGKTTTKEALRAALEASGQTHASPASFNNHWGVPLTLARLPRTARFAVIEIGMNHGGEITPLAAMTAPDVAIVTEISESHLGHFASLADIARAKAEIFTGLVEGGCAVINRDTPFFADLAAAARAAGAGRIVGFGRHEEASARLLDCTVHEACTCVRARIDGEEMTFKIGIPGAHMAMNAVAALAAVDAVGGDMARAVLALGKVTPAAGRGVRARVGLKHGSITLIDESYNANPASMRAALTNLANAAVGKGGRRVAVLGDMLELGEHAARLHGELAGDIDANGIDVVYACGDHMRQLWERLDEARRGAYASHSAALAEALAAGLRDGDAVMIKGSLGSKMGLLVEMLRGESVRDKEATPC